jgi:hypothetical protein
MTSVSTACSDSLKHSSGSSQDEVSSTDASDDDEVFCDCSSDSEHDDDIGTTVQTCVFSATTLLQMRSLFAGQETPENVRYGTCFVSDMEASAEARPAPKASLDWRRPEGVSSQALPEPAAESWTARQRRSNTDDDAKFLRAARAALNKLTMEKFEPLFEQLTGCGIQKPHHISMLMHEIFEKATIQHTFIPMYADLCVRLEKDPTISDVVKIAGESHNFRRLLLNQCQIVFEQVLEPTACDAEQVDTDEERKLIRKQRALGNMKLIGQLLVDGMLSSDLFVQCCEDLLRHRLECSEALEALVALMMVAGPTFDKKGWQFFNSFEKILVDMKALTKDKQTPPRLRFLIRDVLDARDAGWPSSAKTAEKIVNQASEKKSAEVINSGVPSKPAQDSVRKSTTEKPRPTSPSEKTFDVVAFRRTLAKVLSDLASDGNIPAAVQCIRSQEVPLASQASQFVDILSRVVEERRGAVRRCQLAFIAGLVAAESSALDRNECLSGLKRFFEEAYGELCTEVNRLPGIMKSEFMPTMMTVIPAADLNSVVPAAMRK